MHEFSEIESVIQCNALIMFHRNHWLYLQSFTSQVCHITSVMTEYIQIA